MKRTVLIAAASALALAGCGSSGHAAPKSARQAQSGYYNMVTLANAIKTSANTNPAELQPGGAMVTGVTCILSGPQTAECNAQFSDATSMSVAVTISADGRTYISHAQ